MSASAPPQRQRVAAYAVLRRDADLLLAHISEHIHDDMWTLPGGGVDHGEDPRVAAAREVYEESGLRVRVGRVLDVHSRHFTGRRPDGRLEDFHGIGLIFEAEVLPESHGVDPRVVEVDGTTRAVAWVPLAELADTPLSATARHAVVLLDELEEVE
jgi:8-oxo-dGTP diphosphatase